MTNQTDTSTTALPPGLKVIGTVTSDNLFNTILKIHGDDSGITVADGLNAVTVHPYKNPAQPFSISDIVCDGVPQRINPDYSFRFTPSAVLPDNFINRNIVGPYIVNPLSDKIIEAAKAVSRNVDAAVASVDATVILRDGVPSPLARECAAGIKAGALIPAK